jgi:KipI family sensor histidine kinase inhibitor
MDSRIISAGETAWLIELPERLDPEVNERAIEIAAAVEQASLPDVTDVVVGYRSVMVYVDPLSDHRLATRSRLDEIVARRSQKKQTLGGNVEVPVCYGGAYGPDLDDLATFAACSAGEVVEMHTAREYRVFVVGFVPGWAYMASVDSRISAPRRSIPRLKVPAGSVAIAAGQTGIYPAETPGGWHIVGRTPVKPYDPARADPFLFHPGDHVRFRRIDEDEYRRTSAWENPR